MGLLWMLVVFTALAAPPPAPPPDPEELLQEARHLSRVGALELAGGGLALGGGVVCLLIGRGEPGGISTETQAMSDLRSIGGAGLIIGGLALSLVGGNSISRAGGLREQARNVQVSVYPGGVMLGGRF